MQTEEIIDRLRNPQKYNKMPPSLQKQERQAVPSVRAASKKRLSGLLILGVCAGVIGIAVIGLLVMLNAKNRAENLTQALDAQQVQGLSYETDFDPRKNVTYVQIYEGQDRNVAVDQLGTTLPIISRYNYQAITPKNYGVIGAAPWALTSNFEANLQDPEMIRYLLNRKEVGEAFIERPDVAPLLADPQLLAAFVQDQDKLQEFFGSDVVKQVFNNDAMVQVVSGSLFMSHLLTSKALKYYRDNPQEAVSLIRSVPALQALTQYPALRKAVQTNFYLKKIAPQLLNNPVKPTAAPAQTAAKKQNTKKKK